MRTLEVTVNQDHINRGRPNACHACPVALALLDALNAGPADYITVGRERIELRSAFLGSTEHYALPEKVTNWIWAFDAGEEVKPITFTATEIR